MGLQDEIFAATKVEGGNPTQSALHLLFHQVESAHYGNQGLVSPATAKPWQDDYVDATLRIALGRLPTLRRG